MSSQTKELFEVLRQRARLKGAPYSDKELEELVKTINPHSHSLYYIGSISFQDINLITYF
ncbi:MAG: hypothetical protein QXF25_03105 [Candidatus Pacearchaeota archaeon]